MFYFYLALFLCLLTLSLSLQKMEKEKGLWIKIVMIFFSFYFSLNIGFIKIPLLILIVYFVITTKSYVNKKIKLQVLLFSLLMFIFVQYIILPLSFNERFELRKQIEEVKKFKEVKSIHYYSQKSLIQDKLRRFGTDSCEIMFSVWVYDYKNIPIKNYEWIWRYSYSELDINWSVSNGPKQSQVYIRFNETGEEYLGLFKKDNEGEYYLEIVIEGKLKEGERPKSLLDRFLDVEED